MSEIICIDRKTGQKFKEQVYQEWALYFIYGDSLLSCFVRPWLLPLVTRIPIFSRVFGYFQKRSSSIRKIGPFIRQFGVDTSEFLDPVSYYRSFNDFFIRKLKPKSRPIEGDSSLAVIPADGRYYFYDNIETCQGFIVKGKKFSLDDLLQDRSLAEKYRSASMVIARLCPTDYHRFHFPCDCTPGPSRLINGYLYSVNPVAIKKNINIMTQNKRFLSEIESDNFGKILYLEIGATTVGSIQETYIPGRRYQKGAEKGYFEFGGSALILLFLPGVIQFDQDLLQATEEGYEIRCLLGQSMGTSRR
jgi:phosphatidylserine decarboxylase